MRYEVLSGIFTDSLNNIYQPQGHFQSESPGCAFQPGKLSILQDVVDGGQMRYTPNLCDQGTGERGSEPMRVDKIVGAVRDFTIDASCQTVNRAVPFDVHISDPKRQQILLKSLKLGDAWHHHTYLHTIKLSTD